MTARDVQRALTALANPAKAKVLQRFFKTGPGEYAEGDRFHGVVVPQQRQVAREFKTLPIVQCRRLLRSPMHEERLVALFILIHQFERGDEPARGEIYQLYLAHTRFINNWDLVDLSAPRIVGAWLWTKNRAPLYRLAQSRSLWERRIGVLATHHFIRQNQFADTLALAEILLSDRADLIHKAVGWMLREVGKRDLQALNLFLTQHAAVMPRTMLRYAIEKFSLAERQHHLHRKTEAHSPAIRSPKKAGAPLAVRRA
jgi:3-methyladenine DNA glycosylase AlkD